MNTPENFTTQWFTETLAKLNESDREQAFKDDQLSMILSMPPKAAWIKKHDMTGQDFIPANIIRRNLILIFGRYEVEVIASGQMFQSMYCVVRLRVWLKSRQEWWTLDGIGAADIQTDKGSSAADLSAIKSGAVQRGLPSAKSYAFKNAAKELGPLFGSELNKKNPLSQPFSPIGSTALQSDSSPMTMVIPPSAIPPPEVPAPVIIAQQATVSGPMPNFDFQL